MKIKPTTGCILLRYRRMADHLKHLKILCAMVLLLLLSACARPQLSPITPEPTGHRQDGQIIWHDLITDELEVVKEFYGKLLGWTFEEHGEYTLVRNADEPIAGIVVVKDEGQEKKSAGWISYFSMADIKETAKWVTEMDGEVLRGPGEMKGRGRYATLIDSRGAPLVILNAVNGDPIPKSTPVGGWLWNELWTDDVEKSLSFYQSFGGYGALRTSEAGEDDYWVLIDANDHWQAGITQAPFEGLPPQWVPVVRVTDPKKVAQSVEGLGGKVIINPDHPLSNGSVALIQDPTGGIIMVESWEPDNSNQEQ